MTISSPQVAQKDSKWNDPDSLKKGQCALIVLAGGTGSRLGFDGPKGCFPVTLVKHKTLFQLILEKVKAASRLYERPLEVAFMTSKWTHQNTIDYLEKHRFFGLEPQTIHFFMQESWPLFDEEGKQLEGEGPNGNGDLFRAFGHSELLPYWREQQIKTVQVIAVDNPLALPFDETLLGFHNKSQNDVSLVVGLRKSEDEKTGVVVSSFGKMKIIEYIDLKDDQKKIEKFPYANLGIYAFDLEFMAKMKDQLLPIHIAKKRDASKQMCLKYEKFIFDVLPFSKKSGGILYPRHEAFAPLKNFVGEDNIDAVRSSLLCADRAAYLRVTGNSAESFEFELDPCFYYARVELMDKWQGKEFPKSSYIEGL